MSDAVIILVSAAALTAGLYRWQNSMDPDVLVRSTPAVISSTGPTAEPQVNEGRPNVLGNAVTSRNAAASGTVLRTPNDNTVAVGVTTPVNIATGSNNVTTSSNIAGSPLYGSYIVRSGDSLSLIAQRYGSSVAALQDINGISGTLIQIGQEVLYPLPAN